MLLAPNCLLSLNFTYLAISTHFFNPERQIRKGRAGGVKRKSGGGGGGGSGKKVKKVKKGT